MQQIATPSTATSPRTRAPRTYNPAPIRRHCRLIEIDAAHIAHFACYSMTRQGTDVRHQPAIDLASGECTCNCEHFEFKLARLHPTVFSPVEQLCKHLHRAIGVARHHDMLPTRPASKCLHCGGEAEIEVCDSHGYPIPNQWICPDCIAARVDDLSDAAPAVPSNIDPVTGEILQEASETTSAPTCWRCSDELGPDNYCFSCGDWITPRRTPQAVAA